MVKQSTQTAQMVDVAFLLYGFQK